MSLWEDSACCPDSGRVYTSSSMSFKLNVESFPIAHMGNKNHLRQTYKQSSLQNQTVDFPFFVAGTDSERL